MKKLVLFFIVLIIPMAAEASKEQIHNPRSVSLVVFTGEHFGEVKAGITANAEMADQITLEIQGEKIEIPKQVYGYLAKPLLNTFQIRTEQGYDELPHLYVYLVLQFQTANGEWLPKKVHVNYYNGKIESMSIQTPKEEGGYSWEKIEL